MVRHWKYFPKEIFNKKSGKEEVALVPDCRCKKEEGTRLIRSQGTSKAGVRGKRAADKFTGRKLMGCGGQLRKESGSKRKQTVRSSPAGRQLQKTSADTSPSPPGVRVPAPKAYKRSLATCGIWLKGMHKAPWTSRNYFTTTPVLLSQWITYVKAALSIDWNKRKSFDSSLFPQCHACLLSPSFVWRKGGQKSVSFQGEIRRSSDPFIMLLFLPGFTSEVRKILSTLPCHTVIECNSRYDRGTSSWKSAESKVAIFMTGLATWKTAHVIRRWLWEGSAFPLSPLHIICPYVPYYPIYSSSKANVAEKRHGEIRVRNLANGKKILYSDK